MARAKLFDSCERVDGRPASNMESSFEFLNRVCSPWWDRVRCELEQWFVDYPANHQRDLRGRFRSSKADQHWPAWWELYLFRLFTHLQYEIEVHPKLESSNAKPDFYLRSPYAISSPSVRPVSVVSRARIKANGPSAVSLAP
jgi:hypothetical protein